MNVLYFWLYFKGFFLGGGTCFCWSNSSVINAREHIVPWRNHYTLYITTDGTGSRIELGTYCAVSKHANNFERHFDQNVLVFYTFVQQPFIL
jgi:hypothetical protein